MCVYAFVVLMLPFIHLVEYLNHISTLLANDRIWGMAIRPPMTDIQTIRVMALIGSNVAFSFTLGSILLRYKKQVFSRLTTLPKSLLIQWWLLLLLISFFFSLVSTPPDTLITATYQSSQALFRTLNFFNYPKRKCMYVSRTHFFF